MGRRRRTEIAICYHTFVTVLLLICAGLCLALGIWALRTSFGSLGRLSWLGSNIHSVTAKRGGVITASLSSVFFLATIFAALSFRVDSLRYVFIAFAIITVGVCGFLAGISWALCATYQSAQVQARFSIAWFRTSDAQQCVIESVRACRGFFRDCGIARCAKSCGATIARTQRCYYALTNTLFTVALPVAIISTITCLLVLADIGVVLSL